jgi:shikimate kinase
MAYQNIVLIGMAGSGKSEIGKGLAERIARNFIDTDRYIEKVMKKPISRIFKEKGEEGFLKIEMNCILDLKLNNDVVSTGGSAVLNSGIMKYLKRDGILVYLHCNYDTIEKRVKNPEQRTVVGISEMSLKEIYNYRLPLYRKYSNQTIYTEGKNKKEIIETIVRRIQ